VHISGLVVYCTTYAAQASFKMDCETVPGTGEVARFPAETLGRHKDGLCCS
jgi:hypothetical protein